MLSFIESGASIMFSAFGAADEGARSKAVTTRFGTAAASATTWRTLRRGRGVRYRAASVAVKVVSGCCAPARRSYRPGANAVPSYEVS